MEKQRQMMYEVLQIPMSHRARLVPTAVGEREFRQRSVKLVLLGDAGAGKTSLFRRIADNCFEFARKRTPTIDIHVFYAYLDPECAVVTQVKLFDIPGDDRLWDVVPLYTRDMNGAIFVFDSTDRRSFDNLGAWKRMLEKGTASCPRILVATKKDLYSNVDSETDEPIYEQFMQTLDFDKEAERLGAECGFRFVSSRTGDGVNDAILTLAAAADCFPDTPHNVDMTNRFESVDISTYARRTPAAAAAAKGGGGGGCCGAK